MVRFLEGVDHEVRWSDLRNPAPEAGHELSDMRRNLKKETGGGGFSQG